MKKYIGFCVFVVMMASWNSLAAQQKRDEDYFKRRLWQAVVRHLEKPAQNSTVSKKSEQKKVHSSLQPPSKRDSIEQFVSSFAVQSLDFLEYDKVQMMEWLGIPESQPLDRTLVTLPPVRQSLSTAKQKTEKPLMYTHDGMLILPGREDCVGKVLEQLGIPLSVDADGTLVVLPSLKSIDPVLPQPSPANK